VTLDLSRSWSGEILQQRQISNLRQVLFYFEIKFDIAADEAWGRGYHAMGTNTSFNRDGESGSYLGQMLFH